MEVLTTNAGTVRREQIGDKSFWVASATFIVPGVLPGSKGPLLYPRAEVAKNPDAWNGMPVVVNHPTVDGRNVSARSPRVLEKYQVGHVYNAEINRDGKLVGELWFDEARTRRVEPRILDSLQAKRPIELSTGLFTRNEPAVTDNGVSPSHNGVQYTHVARDYRPDHLAVLPDATGACSLRDGCGVLVNAQARVPAGSSKGGQFAPGTWMRVKTDATLKKAGVDTPHPRAGHAGTFVSHDDKEGTAILRLDHEGGKQIKVKASHLEPHDSRPVGPAKVVSSSDSAIDIHRKFGELKAGGNRKDADEYLQAVVEAKGRSYLHGLASDHGVSTAVNPGGKGLDTATPGQIIDRILTTHFPTTNSVAEDYTSPPEVSGVLVNTADQPRVPAGSEHGGEFAPAAGSKEYHLKKHEEFAAKSKAATFKTPEYEAAKQGWHASYNSADAFRVEAEEAAREKPSASRIKGLHTEAEKSHRTAARLAKKVGDTESVDYHKKSADFHKDRITELSGGVYRPTQAAYVRSDIGKKSRVNNETSEEVGVLVNGRTYGFTEADVDETLANMARNQPRDDMGRWTGGRNLKAGKGSKRADKAATAQAQEHLKHARDAEKSGDHIRAQGHRVAAYGYNRAAELHAGGEHHKARAVAAVADEFGSGKRKLTAKPKALTANESFDPADLDPEDAAWIESLTDADEVLNALPDMSPEKACLIMKDGEIKGHKLTRQQQKMFGALCGQRAEPTGNDGQSSKAKKCNCRKPDCEICNGQYADLGREHKTSPATTDQPTTTTGNAFDPKQPRDELGRFASSHDAMKAADEASEKAGKSNTKKDHERAASIHERASEMAYAEGYHQTARRHSDAARGHRETAKVVRNSKKINTVTNEGTDMGREADIAYLTTNCDCWRGRKDALEDIEDDGVINTLRKTSEKNAELTLTVNTIAAGGGGSNKTVKTAAEWYAEAPAEIQEVVRNAKAIQDAEKLKLVEKVVTANATTKDGRDAIRPTFLAMPLDTLKTLAANLPDPTANVGYNPFAAMGLPVRRPVKVNDYSGAAGSVSAVTANSRDDEDDAGAVLPTINSCDWNKADLRAVGSN